MPCLAPDLEHHAAQRVAGQRIGGGAQRGFGVGCAHRHQQTRIETEFAIAAQRQRAGFALREILPHPQQRPDADPPRQAGDEAGRRGAVPAGLGEHLMQRAERQPALQRGIGPGMAERHPAQILRVGVTLDPLDIAAQIRKRGQACAGHAPLLWNGLPSQVGINPCPAHLFMICSNIKLTAARESIGIGIKFFAELNQGLRRSPPRRTGSPGLLDRARPGITAAMNDKRKLLRAIFDAAVAAAHPAHVLRAHLRPLPRGRVICLAAGKGAAAMAAAAERHYLDDLGLEPQRLIGVATTRHGHGVPTRRIEVIEAGHPVPDEAGLRGAEASLALAHGATAEDLLLVLLSGGGSANWIAPVAGISFAQKQQLTRALLRSGAPIGEVNTVRKHLSRIKGGRLARAGQRAEIVTLAISDVPRDEPSAIASGPTVPDPTTLADARAIVAQYGLAVDDAIRHALDDPANESCKHGDAAFARASFELIARPRQSLDAAIEVARDAGYAIADLGADLEGEARDVAAEHARLALQARAEGKKLAIMSGGELTVTVRGNGHGGPNQEYALALAMHLKDMPGLAALAADTDGADGGAGSATDPAGAIIDDGSFAKIKALGLDPAAYLTNNDATAFFAATGDLLVSGPTLTNVNDIRVILT